MKNLKNILITLFMILCLNLYSQNTTFLHTQFSGTYEIVHNRTSNKSTIKQTIWDKNNKLDDYVEITDTYSFVRYLESAKRKTLPSSSTVELFRNEKDLVENFKTVTIVHSKESGFISALNTIQILGTNVDGTDLYVLVIMADYGGTVIIALTKDEYDIFIGSLK